MNASKFNAYEVSSGNRFFESTQRLIQPRPAVWDVILLFVAMTYFAINVRWVWLYRRGQVLDIDEAGYFAIALNNFHALANGGLLQWIMSVEAPSIQSPLTTAAASLIFGLVGPHIVVGFLIPVFAGTVAVLAVYFLGARLAGRRFGLLCAVAVACCPLLLNYSRSFHFALPATAVTTLAVLALVQSNRFRSFGWSIAFGLFVGLMPLARTMTVAFIPGLLIGALVFAFSEKWALKQALVHMIVAGFVATVTSATWLAFNGQGVAQYLLNYGYGNRSAEYGPGGSRIENVIVTFRYAAHYLHFPYVVLLSLGAFLHASFIARRWWRNGFGPTLETVVRSPLLVLVIFVVSALLVLASSSNKGTAFVAPVVPAMIVLAVWALFVPNWPRVLKLVFGAGLAACLAFAILPAYNLDTPLAKRSVINVPMLGQFLLMDGRSPIEDYMSSTDIGDQNATRPISSEVSAAWMQMSLMTYDRLIAVAKPGQLVTFGFRGYVYNSNTVSMANILKSSTRLSITAIDPLAVGSTVEDYTAWLTQGAAGGTCILLTAPGNSTEILPAVNTPEMEEAARRLKFITVESWTMPNGRKVTMWKRICPSR
jgi:4-amino-4-deoxy-L-arabinose transferase-like glycosyltransferase